MQLSIILAAAAAAIPGGAGNYREEDTFQQARARGAK